MKAPEICRYTYWTDEVEHLTTNTLKVMDEVFEMLGQIEKINDEAWFLWLHAERGTFEEYKKSKHYDTNFDTEKVFFEYYPNEIVWIPLLAIKNKYAMLLRIGRLSLTHDTKPYCQDSFCNDYVAVLKWVKTAIKTSIKELENGTYNENVRNNLPYEQRYGTLSRKLFWQYYPQDRSYSLEGLTDNEIKEFLSILENEPDDYIPSNPINSMTFNKYFAIAYECFKSLGLKITDNVFETFESYGEDFGGRIFYKINLDSEVDFDDVYLERKGGEGGHPWGILRGSSRTRLMLYPHKTAGGYIFRFSGNPNWSICKIVKCYTTLKKMNVPACFCGKAETIEYLKEEDLVGFVPETRMPVYCQSEFDEKVNDFRRYSTENYGKIQHLIHWRKIRELKLIK